MGIGLPGSPDIRVKGNIVEYQGGSLPTPEAYAQELHRDFDVMPGQFQVGSGTQLIAVDGLYVYVTDIGKTSELTVGRFADAIALSVAEGGGNDPVDHDTMVAKLLEDYGPEGRMYAGLFKSEVKDGKEEMVFDVSKVESDQFFLDRFGRAVFVSQKEIDDAQVVGVQKEDEQAGKVGVEQAGVATPVVVSVDAGQGGETVANQQVVVELGLAKEEQGGTAEIGAGALCAPIALVVVASAALAFIGRPRSR